jgi:hypothetical protein
VHRAHNLPPSYAESGNLGASISWNPQGISRPVIGLTYPSTSLKEAVLHTICAEAAKIKASYVTTNSMMMGCMESNWMTQTEQQTEKNSYGNLSGYKCNALNIFEGFKRKSHV